MSIFNTMRLSGYGMTAERLRMDVISNNIANSQTTRTAVGSMAANLDQETLAGLATDLAAESAALAGLAPFDSSAPIDSA